MANGPAIAIGIFLLFLAGLGFIYPVNDSGHTIVQADELCSSDLGQLAQFFVGRSAQESCQQIKLMSYGVYGFGLIGIILVIVGAVVSGGQKEVHHYREVKGDDNPLDILKKRLAKGEISQDEYNKLKKEFE